MVERRGAERRRPADDETLSRVRLRVGRDLKVIDVSSSGVLVEGRVRLLPGTQIDLHVITRGGRVLTRARVTRSAVHRLRGDTIEYRSALAFERLLDTAAHQADQEL